MGPHLPTGDEGSIGAPSVAGPKVRLELVDAREPDSLTIHPGSFEWVGPWCDEPPETNASEGARARARVVATEDDVSVSAATWVLDVLRALPLPPLAFLALARWLWEHDTTRAGRLADGSLPGDECLRLALGHTDPRVRTVRRYRWAREVLIEQTQQGSIISDVAMRPSGTPACLSVGPEGAVDVCWTGVGGRGPERYTMPTGTDRAFFVACLDSEGDVLVARYAYGNSECELFVDGLAGDWSAPIAFTLASPPTRWFLAEGRLWVHALGETVGIAVDANRHRVAGDLIRIPQPKQRNAVSAPPLRLGHHLTGEWVEPGVDPKRALRSLAWVDLRAPDQQIFLGTAQTPPTMFVHDGALYATSLGELHRARAGEPAEVLARGVFRGAALAGDTIWLGETHANAQGVTRLRLGDAHVLSRTSVPFLTETLVAVEGGVLAMSSMQAAYVDVSGVLIALTAQRGTAGWARLSDGTLVFGSGEEVFVVSPTGELLRKRMMPFAGMILGTVAGHALFGPGPAQWDRAEPAAIHMIDTQGDSVATLRPDASSAPRLPMQISWPEGAFRSARVGAESAVLTLEGAGRTLVSHRPVPESADALLPAASPTWLAPTRAHERVVQGSRTNPRDDWKEPGLVVRGQAVVARDGTYAGTTGVVEGSAVEAHDGAVVVLLDCDLREGGVEIHGDAVVILVRCTVGPKTRSLGPTGRVFEHDCRTA